MVDLTLSLLWSLFTTVPGLVILVVLLFASFVSGIAYTRRSIRNDPEAFAARVVQAKELASEVRARWQRVLDQLRGL